MIISARKALSIVSNHAVIQAVPELLGLVEKVAQIKKEVDKPGCGDCGSKNPFSEVELEALKAIASLNTSAIVRLKKFLGAKDLYVNPVESGADATLIELK